VEEFSHYRFSDFCSDDDFRRWVEVGRPQEHPIWGEILSFYPDKSEDFNQAAEVIEQLLSGEGPLSQGEVEHEVTRILRSTDTQETKRFSVSWYWAAALLVGMVGWLARPASKTAEFSFHSIAEAETEEVVDLQNTYSDSVIVYRLPDGSSIQMYPGARLRYLSKEFIDGSAENAKREVFMTGDIFFDVAEDKKRPFIVYTNDFLTRVVGTQFLIRLSGDQPSVEVKSGRVVVRKILSEEGEEVALTPNQKVTFLPQVKQLEKGIASSPELLEEASSEVYFAYDNAPLSEVFNALEKAYGIRIRFDADKLKSCFISVRLGDENFYAKLEVICRTIGAKYVEENGEVIISGEGCGIN
jgi:transmembrane sensor